MGNGHFIGAVLRSLREVRKQVQKCVQAAQNSQIVEAREAANRLHLISDKRQGQKVRIGK